MRFYDTTLNALKKSGKIGKSDTILVVCGGKYDAICLAAAGMESAIISNLDDQYDGQCAPYDWKYLDAENLDVPNESYDWVIEHAGLHHCASPHRGMLEMYRVARKGILVIEARDSALMRLAVKTKFAPEYELESVALSPDWRGGLRHSGNPNFIYRWTEREVHKTIETAHPDREHVIEYHYGLGLPTERLTMVNPAVRVVANVAGLFVKGLFRLIPSQGNHFAFTIEKNDRVKPWIAKTAEGNILDRNYKTSFDPEKYQREDF